MKLKKDELVIMRHIHGDKSDVFRYFVTPDLLEQWCMPEGMTLRVPHFEARIGGSYRFEHTSKDGVYICEGRIADFQPGSKLVQVDSAIGPDGTPIFSNMETVITFNQKPGGTFVTVTQKGFADESFLDECERGWSQCFDKLASLFSGSLSAAAS